MSTTANGEVDAFCRCEAQASDHVGDVETACDCGGMFVDHRVVDAARRLVVFDEPGR